MRESSDEAFRIENVLFLMLVSTTGEVPAEEVEPPVAVRFADPLRASRAKGLDFNSTYT